VSIVARGQGAGSGRAGLVEQPTGIAASLRKDGSVGVDRFGFRVTRQTADLTFVGCNRDLSLETLRATFIVSSRSALAVLRPTTFAATRRLWALQGSAGRAAAALVTRTPG
jgi:hypothetical protein